MKLLYRIGIQLMSWGIGLAALFSPKLRLFKEGRKGLLGRLEKDQRILGKKEWIWFHCASLGEFEQARPLIEKIKQQQAQYSILLSFFSPSGYEIRKNYALADYVCYLPLDKPMNARRFVKAFSPKMVFFVKYEFWYYHLKFAKDEGAKLYSIAAVIRKNSIFFKWYGALHRKMLGFFDRLFVQDTESVENLKKLGINKSQLCGDPRFDRVYAQAQAPRELIFVKGFAGAMPLLVLGSAWKQDLQVIAPVLNRSNPQVKIILATHEVDEAHLKEAEAFFPQLKSIRYSQISQKNLFEYDLLLIDNIGMLSSLYAYADIAYVGGAFSKGLHNILEPATFGIPILFGPKIEKFPEAQALCQKKGAYVCVNKEGFEKHLNNLLSDKDFRLHTGKVCRTFVQENLGATALIYSKTLENA